MNLRAAQYEVKRSLKIAMKADRIECFLDGAKHLDGRDDTFQQAAKVGLWTKAYAQTHFDAFQLRGR